MDQQSPTSSLSIAVTSVEKRLLWLVRDLVIQSCSYWPKNANPAYDDPIPVFSGFIGVHAEAIVLLAEYGLVVGMTDDGGRVVAGKVLPTGESARVLRTGPFREKNENGLPSAADLDAVANEDSVRKATR